MHLSQEKSVREFSSVDDVVAYFDQNPVKLVQYIQEAIRVKASVPGKCLTQLASLVQVPLAYKGEHALVPPHLFVSPKRFSNIDAIMKLAQTDFPVSNF
ncbi:MAG: hypothetical protein A2481_03110 [Candidatus Yonathbacteria bacterium RIFOXYC2_FULL_47_9]|nr:MAG: hypothetical protein A2481_03110 [Candidatus Yonathbacteria bacterium RIFOXYC2_FULL_47_9]HAT68359.1 hypothetical protein [Candidatus Yonathbacteria bacterium]